MRVAIAEDSGIFRQALVTLLTTYGMDVVYAARTGDELLENLDADLPDAVILDMHMPPDYTDEGVKVALHIKEHYPDMGILVLSAYNETPQAMELFRNKPKGVGYLLKDHVTDIDNLRGALERVVRGDVVIDPDIVSRLVEARHWEGELSRLSEREREILALMAQGRSNTGIGKTLHLSSRTVEDHVRSIFTKLELSSSPSTEANRRVLAVLTWLRASGSR